MAKPNTNKGVKTERGWLAKNSKFKPEYCQRLIDHCGKGHSIAQFNRDLGICRWTFDNWTEAHEDFKQAKRIAVEGCRAYWDDQVEAYAVESYEGDRLNVSHLKYIAQERFQTRELVELKDTSNVAQCFADVLLAVSKGKLSIDEAGKYGQLFLGMATAQQHETMWNDIEELKQSAAKNQSERFGDTETNAESRRDY